MESGCSWQSSIYHIIAGKSRFFVITVLLHIYINNIRIQHTHPFDIQPKWEIFQRQQQQQHKHQQSTLVVSWEFMCYFCFRFLFAKNPLPRRTHHTLSQTYTIFSLFLFSLFSQGFGAVIYLFTGLVLLHVDNTWVNIESERITN